MAEISGIQLLGVILIIILFYLVFHIIAINWSYKMTENSLIPDEGMDEEAEKESILYLPVNSHDVRIIPLGSTIKDADTSLSKGSPAREVAFLQPEPLEETIGLSKAL